MTATLNVLRSIWVADKTLRRDVTDLANAIKAGEVVVAPAAAEMTAREWRDLRQEAESEQAAEGAWLRHAEMGNFYDDPRGD